MTAAVMGCLGAANYWTTIPFFIAVGVIAVLQVWLPNWYPTLGAPRWKLRAFGLIAIVVVPFAVADAASEARDRPNCEPVAVQIDQEQGVRTSVEILHRWRVTSIKELRRELKQVAG